MNIVPDLLPTSMSFVREKDLQRSQLDSTRFGTSIRPSLATLQLLQAALSHCRRVRIEDLELFRPYLRGDSAAVCDDPPAVHSDEGQRRSSAPLTGQENGQRHRQTVPEAHYGRPDLNGLLSLRWQSTKVQGPEPLL